MTGGIKGWTGCLLGAAVLCGCGPDGRTPAAPRLTVAVTIAPQGEFVERVGGELVEPLVMLPPGAEPHTYEPTPQQLVRLSAAHAYAQVGSGIAFERLWMERIGEANPDMLIIDCGAGIETVGNDPHVWLSLRHARAMADAIRAGLTRLDAAQAATYQRNFEAYAAELTELDALLARQIQASGLRAFLVYHPSWGYFARDYGLEQMSVEHEGKEPTALRLGHVIEAARKAQVGAVFVSPQFEVRSAQAVAAEIGAHVLAVDPLPRRYVDEMRRFGAALSPAGR